MNHFPLARHWWVAVVVLSSFGLCQRAAWSASACVSIASPVAGGSVSASNVPILTTDDCIGQWFECLYVDNVEQSCAGVGQLIWNATSAAPGSHQIKVLSYSEGPNSQLLGTASEAVSLGCLSITSPPTNNALSLNSVVPIGTNDTCAGAWFECLQVDGSLDGCAAPGQLVWNTSAYTMGSHEITVNSYSENPNSQLLASASQTVHLGHYTTLPPLAALPSESSCATAVNQSPLPENAPWNQDDGTGYNSNQPPAGGVPSYFYSNATLGGQFPPADFAKVDGAYAGSTDDIARVYACKWGIDEDVVRAQAWVETRWHQDCPAAHGGSGCAEVGDLDNPPGDPGVVGLSSFIPSTAISPNNVFSGFDAFADAPSGQLTCDSGNTYCTTSKASHWDTWGMWQDKVYYEWEAWPMVQESTPFGADLRMAATRACLNGDEAVYFTSQGTGTAYLAAIAAATTSPGETASNQPVSGFTLTNLDYALYGCVAAHFSGNWYDSAALNYLNNILQTQASAPWPGGIR
ncbi:MAG TPA: hypothetical protein VKV28_12680 [Candidatus Binataceae bacterium]|nr:hypothetical protein [Candidatus Binataceae bacterium]